MRPGWPIDRRGVDRDTCVMTNTDRTVKAVAEYLANHFTTRPQSFLGSEPDEDQLVREAAAEIVQLVRERDSGTVRIEGSPEKLEAAAQAKREVDEAREKLAEIEARRAT